MVHLVIIRTGGTIIDLETYNCQELGLAKALTLKGIKVSLIIAGKENKVKTIKYHNNTIQVYYSKFKSINQALSWFEKTEELLDKLNPTHIQIHEFGMLMSYRIVKWSKKKQIDVFLIQGSYQTTNKILFKQLEYLFNITLGSYVLKNVKKIGCKSLKASEYIKKYTSKETQPAYIGLDIEKFFNPSTCNWVEKLNIKKKNILLYIGSMEPRRNPNFLIQVLQCLSDEYVLLLVGNGIMSESLKTTIKTEKLSDRCFFLGKLKQEDLPSLYKIADLFLLASDYEIYGMVILEAMYYGTPVISTLTAGSEILIKDNKTGIILPHKDKLIWSQTIQELCSDKKRLYKMKLQASAKIRNELTWDKASNMFLSLYNIKP